MARLISVTNLSRDGYIEDQHGNIDWTPPDDELFALITDVVRPVGTYLYGRRMYDTMAVWETDPTLAAQSELKADFANVWQAACRPHLRPRLGPRPEGLGHRRSHRGRPTPGGAGSPGRAGRRMPSVRPPRPRPGRQARAARRIRADLELLDDRQLGNGVVYLGYRIPT